MENHAWPAGKGGGADGVMAVRGCSYSSCASPLVRRPAEMVVADGHAGPGPG